MSLPRAWASTQALTLGPASLYFRPNQWRESKKAFTMVKIRVFIFLTFTKGKTRIKNGPHCTILHLEKILNRHHFEEHKVFYNLYGQIPLKLCIDVHYLFLWRNLCFSVPWIFEMGITGPWTLIYQHTVSPHINPLGGDHCYLIWEVDLMAFHLECGWLQTANP